MTREVAGATGAESNGLDIATGAESKGLDTATGFESKGLDIATGADRKEEAAATGAGSKGNVAAGVGAISDAIELAALGIVTVHIHSTPALFPVQLDTASALGAQLPLIPFPSKDIVDTESPHPFPSLNKNCKDSPALPVWHWMRPVGTLAVSLAPLKPMPVSPDEHVDELLMQV